MISSEISSFCGVGLGAASVMSSLMMRSTAVAGVAHALRAGRRSSAKPSVFCSRDQVVEIVLRRPRCAACSASISPRLPRWPRVSMRVRGCRARVVSVARSAWIRAALGWAAKSRTMIRMAPSAFLKSRLASASAAALLARCRRRLSTSACAGGEGDAVGEKADHRDEREHARCGCGPRRRETMPVE